MRDAMAPLNPPVDFMTVLLVIVLLWKAALDALPRPKFPSVWSLNSAANNAFDYKIYIAEYNSNSRSFDTTMGLPSCLFNRFGEALKQWLYCDVFTSVMLPHACEVLSGGLVILRVLSRKLT
jgi:hypothetical protein